MFSRLTLLLCALSFVFIAACAGSKGGSSYSDDDDYSGGGGGGRAAAMPKKEELKEAHEEAVSLTEENHKMSKEIFDLKNKLGLPTDE